MAKKESTVSLPSEAHWGMVALQAGCFAVVLLVIINQLSDYADADVVGGVNALLFFVSLVGNMAAGFLFIKANQLSPKTVSPVYIYLSLLYFAFIAWLVIYNIGMY